MRTYDILSARPTESLYFELHVAVEEERHAVALLCTERHNAVAGTAIITIRPQLHNVAHVDDKGVLLDGNGDPCLSGWVPHFEALTIWLLQKDSHPAEVSVVANCVYSSQPLDFQVGGVQQRVE